jgi:Cys-tRNA(Pro)/Cys-tRNA(Cys) deacylase
MPPPTPALAALVAAKVAHTVHAYELDERVDARGGRHAYGEETAAALAVSPERLLKTLVAAVDGTLVLGVVPVAGELDLKALAAAVGGRRAVMAEPATAERATGYVVGGISPLGGRRRLPTVVDEGALAHATVFVSAGRRGLQVEVDPADLVGLTGATIAPIARG